MKIREWRLILLMALPIAALAIVPQIARDPEDVLRERIEGDWYSHKWDSKLSIAASADGALRAEFTGLDGRRMRSTLRVVDGSHVHVDAKGEWMPNTILSTRFSGQGNSMELDSSEGLDPTMVSTWEPWSPKSGT